MINLDQTKTSVEPNLSDALTYFRRDIFMSMNCVKIGEIQSFNPTKKTAQVKLLFKRSFPDGTQQSYRPLVDVPVLTVQGGGGGLFMPIKAGDQCIVLFSDRNINNWLRNGNEAAPADGRCHDMSDGIALVGINSMASTLPAYPANTCRLSYAGAEIDLASGNIDIKTGNGEEITLTGGKVSLKNGSTSLLTILNGLVDQIKAIGTQGGPTAQAVSPASQAALEAYKTQIAGLLS